MGEELDLKPSRSSINLKINKIDTQEVTMKKKCQVAQSFQRKDNSPRILSIKHLVDQYHLSNQNIAAPAA